MVVDYCGEGSNLQQLDASRIYSEEHLFNEISIFNLSG